MMKTVKDLRTEFIKEIAMLKTYTEMNMELKNPNSPIRNSKESFVSRMNQAKGRIPGLKDKVENLDQIRKEYEEK